MDSVPLIPKSNRKENHDVSFIIREVFQDIISKPQFSKNVADNTQKYNLENQNLKGNGDIVVAAYNDTKLSMGDIRCVEGNLMAGQGNVLKSQDVIEKDQILTEFIKLKRQGIYSDLDLNKVKKYGLLQKIDLLPSRPERSLDFRINSNRHLCPLPCPNALDIYPTKLEKNERKRMPPIKNTKKENKYEIHPETVILDDYNSNAVNKKNVIFKAEPDTVTFCEFEKGIIYEKTFKLRNVSKVTQSFAFHMLPKFSLFKVELRVGTTRVAPGMCAIFSVKYRTYIYRDIEEILTINTYTGSDVEVRLKSCRKPPHLTAYIVRSEQHFVEKCPLAEGVNLCCNTRSIAVNSTIDCGSCLVGNELDITLILINQGTIGKFFFISEENWYFFNTSAVNSDLELASKSFELYPAYFEIDNNACIVMNLKFTPPNYGLAVEKLFLLCDNNTWEELEIVGDGVLFDRNDIIIEVEKKNENMVFMDADSIYYVDFGKCIPHEHSTQTITIHNNSTVSLRYMWEIKESVCHINSDANLEKMNPDWIALHTISDALPNESTTDFHLTLQCKSREAGVYSLVLVLYILDIPEVSLSNSKLYLIENCHKLSMDKLHPRIWNIAVGEIEILCELTPIDITLEPSALIIPFTMKSEDIFKQKVQIYTSTRAALNCKWTLPNTNSIEVCPTTFVLPPEAVFVCDIIVQIHTHEDFEENLIFTVNEGLFITDFAIQAKLVKPMAEFSEIIIDFGKIPQGKEVDGKTVYVQNVGADVIEWEVFEFTYNVENKKIVEVDVKKHVFPTKGLLFKNGRCEITYSIDNPNTDHYRWFSFLILMSLYPRMETMNSVCIVTYEVIQPEVRIHTRSSAFPILYSGKMLYIGCTTCFKLCLHNLGGLCSSFIWGKPTGRHAKCINIKFFPKSGIINPKRCTHVIVSVTPIEAGILDDISVPCFVGHINKCITLTVLCAVDNIHLYFHLPDNCGRVEKVLWPSIGIDESITNFSIAYEIGSEPQEEEYLDSCTTLQPNSETSVEYSVNTAQDIYGSEDNNGYENFDLHLNSEFSLNAEQTESTLFTMPSTVSLKDNFNSDLHEHVLEYRNIPLRTPTKKTIIIENLTPMVGKFDIKAANFAAIEHNDERKDAMDDILDNLNFKKRDEWENSINTEFGIVVKSMPKQGTLPSNHSIEVDIWIYANTWGVYAEEILIEVNDILPFCFNLLIEIKGAPIEYPIAPSFISSEPVIRFGNLPYLSEPLQRKLKVTNFSCVPLSLAWHVFLCKGNSHKGDPFNVFLDTLPLKDCNEETDLMKLMITTKCYGKEDWTIFHVEPRTMTINPKSTETITVTVAPGSFHVKYTKTKIQGYLISFIHLCEEFIHLSNVYSRQTDVQVPPVKLQATLELPMLKLELVKGDIRIRAYANDVLDTQEARYERRLIFRNTNTAPATVFMHVASPFHVISLRTAQTNTTMNVPAATVQPGQCVEVLVECAVDAEQVLQYSDMLFNEKTTVFPETANFKDFSITVSRVLNIHQCGLTKQITPLELVLFYPRLQVSYDTIHFGVVFIGNTKKMLLTLSHSTGSQLPYRVDQQTTSNIILIKPSSGVIPKTCGIVPSSVTLSLYFTPSDCGFYEERIRIITNIPFCCATVLLKGTGSNNEKFYAEGM